MLLGDIRRVNVLLSRAKQKMLFVGSASTMASKGEVRGQGRYAGANGDSACKSERFVMAELMEHLSIFGEKQAREHFRSPHDQIGTGWVSALPPNAHV